jgi:hypothetical protein
LGGGKNPEAKAPCSLRKDKSRAGEQASAKTEEKAKAKATAKANTEILAAPE